MNSYRLNRLFTFKWSWNSLYNTYGFSSDSSSADTFWEYWVKPRNEARKPAREDKSIPQELGTTHVSSFLPRIKNSAKPNFCLGNVSKGQFWDGGAVEFLSKISITVGNGLPYLYIETILCWKLYFKIGKKWGGGSLQKHTHKKTIYCQCTQRQFDVSWYFHVVTRWKINQFLALPVATSVVQFILISCSS